MGSMLYWPTTPGSEGLPWNVAVKPSDTRLERSYFLFSSEYQLQIVFVVKDWALCPLLSLSAGILSGLNLYRSCERCHSL